MNHKQLVDMAGRWLSNSKGCNPVFKEKGSQGCTEMPDAIGWTCEDCIVVECKTSKSDFLANGRKQLNLGSKRYFLMTTELYKEVSDIIPPGYGVITSPDEHHFARQERLMASMDFPRNLEHEVRYLRSRILEVQRYGQC